MITLTQLSEPAYRVKIKEGNGSAMYRYFATKRKAVSYVAWRIIWCKRGMQTHDDPQELASFPERFECTCHDHWESQYTDWMGCDVHDRRDGYFARLHERVVRWIESGYIVLE